MGSRKVVLSVFFVFFCIGICSATRSPFSYESVGGGGGGGSGSGGGGGGHVGLGYGSYGGWGEGSGSGSGSGYGGGGEHGGGYGGGGGGGQGGGGGYAGSGGSRLSVNWGPLVEGFPTTLSRFRWLPTTVAVSGSFRRPQAVSDDYEQYASDWEHIPASGWLSPASFLGEVVHTSS